MTSRGKSRGGSHPLLLNYLTSPDVLLWSAVQASCALPGLMPSVQLMAKNPKSGKEVPFLPGQAVADGSINADLPMQRLAELFNVNNFIVSQVNPHVNPFISSHEVQAPGSSSTRSLTKHIEYLLNIDVQHRCRKLAKIGLFPRVFGHNVSGVFVQRYVGNVTIAPHLSILDNFRAIQHPSKLDMRRYLLVGAQTTWPKLDIIKHMMQWENELSFCANKWNTLSNQKNRSSIGGSDITLIKKKSAWSSTTPKQSSNGSGSRSTSMSMTDSIMSSSERRASSVAGSGRASPLLTTVFQESSRHYGGRSDRSPSSPVFDDTNGGEMDERKDAGHEDIRRRRR